MGGLISKRQSRGVKLSRERRIEYLKKTPFFLYLHGDDLEEFASCFSMAQSFLANETLTLDQEVVYIVSEGELELRTTLPHAHSKVENSGYLCKKAVGDIISKPQAQRQAARKISSESRKLESYVEELKTVACTKTMILYSDKKYMSSFLANHPELSSPINSILDSHIECYLGKIPFLRSVKESQLSVLAAMCRFEAMDENKIIFEENSPGSKLYILLHGEATVLAPQWIGDATTLQQSLEWGSVKCDDKIVVADLKSGDYFGETSLFVNINRTSTVLTKDKSLFVTVEKKTFENFLMVCPSIKDSMTAVMKERMVSKLSSLSIPFLVGIPAGKIELLTNLVEIHETDDECIVFREGEIGDRFYIIVHGQVKVEASSIDEEKKEAGDKFSKQYDELKPKHLGVLGAGNYFGEMALVGDSPRSATVTAINKVILLSVDKDSFHTIFASNENAFAEFTLRLLKESSDLCHFLAHSLGLSSFRSYLRKGCAEENLDFWIAAKEFMEEKEFETMSNRAKTIYELYCDEDGMHQVNLPCSIRSEIKSALGGNGINNRMFQAAMDEIYNLMVRDNYARFKRSPEFLEFFKCLGILICMPEQ